MYFTCDEMGAAFDRFWLSLATRYAENSKQLHVISGQSIEENLKNYVLIVQDSAPELTIVEYCISIEDFRHVPSRESDIQRLVQGFPSGDKELDVAFAKRYLILANDSTDKVDNVEIVEGFGTDNLSWRFPSLLQLMQAVRLDPNLGRSNVFEMDLEVGGELKTVAQLLLDKNDGESEETPSQYYRIDPVAKTGMSMLELYDDIKYMKLNLGIFLIREGDKSALLTHIEPIRDLKDLTASTSFVIGDAISYDELCRLRPLVHEVVFRPDYGLVYWQRSSGGTGKLRKYLTCEYSQEDHQRPPPLHWLNVIHSSQTNGKSMFLRNVQAKFRKDKPFGVVRLVNGTMVEGALSDSTLSTVQRLSKLLGMESELENKIVEVLSKRKDEVMVLVDDAEQVGSLLVQFLKEVERDLGTNVKFWVAAGDQLRREIEEQFAIVAHEFPSLDKVQQADCLELFLPELSVQEIDETLKIARASNCHQVVYESSVDYTISKNVFNLKLIADMRRQSGGSEKSYYLLDLLDLRVENNLADFDDLEAECYKFSIGKNSDRMDFPATVVEYLAAKYLAKHLELVNLTLYRDFPRIATFFDQILSRKDKLATAVLNKDTEQVLLTLETNQESLDSLNRNPLHLSHECLAIQQALIKAGLCLEQRCLLSNFTPLQMADERQDWHFVNLLMENNANNDFPSLRLRTMPNDELEQVVENSITLTHLLDWILNNRQDYLITQKNIYSACALSDTMDQDLLHRMLDRAYEQKLYEREAPYRFMWGSNALHMAAYSGLLDVCKFLVEKLNFIADQQDYSGQQARDETSNVQVTDYLNSLQEADPETDTDEEADREVADSAFIRACNSSNLEMVRYCVEQEGFQFLKPERGHYGFISAVAWGCLPIVEYLYEKGFKDQLDVEDDSEYTALATAVRFEHLPIIKFLVERGADSSKIRDVPIKPEVRRYLSEHCDYNPPISFEYLSQIGLDELRATQYDYSTENEYGEVLLHNYIEFHDDPEVLRFLLTQYDDVDLPCKSSGRTPLLQAIYSNRSPFVDVLLEAGADVYKTCAKTGQNVLHLAAQQHNKRLLDLFLTKFVIDINSRDHTGQTVAFYLDNNASQINLFHYLTKRYGMDVNAQNHEGRTVLHEKILFEGFMHLHEVEQLLRVVGVRQNVTDRKGRLALHYAAEKGNVKVVQLLGRYGVLEWNYRDVDGKTPMDLAKEAAQEQFLEHFEGC